MPFKECFIPGAIIAFLRPSGSPSSISVTARARDLPPWALYKTVLDGPVGTSPAHCASSGVITARADQPVSDMAKGPRCNAGGAGFWRSKRRYGRIAVDKLDGVYACTFMCSWKCTPRHCRLLARDRGGGGELDRSERFIR